MNQSGYPGLRGRRRAVVTLVCAALVLSMLVSSAYIAYEAACHHRCMGKNCPVCQFVAQVGQLGRGFGLALMALLMPCLALSTRRAAFARATAGTDPALCTLVGRRIRLND